ncbi:hypothetical protein HPB52_004534 [Rhipicephalus sanguineus]|uniref:Uncharacterized protein n=1 Tax=Rhipicephalus sanguineus TaxID=34632 RepID=A0A9D4SN01_RHISA|nr:hypothetical protein HPB52_004534 [Rhipicephalus sanguineus]
MKRTSTAAYALLFTGTFVAILRRDRAVASRDADDYSPYNVYYNIKLLETEKWTACLQCFAMPCSPGERVMRPLEESNLCCRFCRTLSAALRCRLAGFTTSVGK